MESFWTEAKGLVLVLRGASAWLQEASAVQVVFGCGLGLGLGQAFAAGAV